MSQTAGASANRLSQFSTAVDAQNYTRGAQYSFFRPKGWGTLAPYKMDFFTFPAQNEGGPGASSKFTIPNNTFTYLAGIVLEWRKAAGAAAVGAAIDDFAAYAMVESVVLQYGSSEVRTITGEEMKSVHYKRWLSEKQQGLIEQTGGPKSLADRQADYNAAKTYRIKIPFQFTESNPLPMVTGNDLVITVNWRNASQVIQGAVVGSTLSFVADTQRIRCEGIHVPEDEQVALQNKANSDSGIMQLMHNVQNVQKAFTLPLSSTAVYSVDLRNITLPYTALHFVVRKQSALDTVNDARRWENQGGFGDPEIQVLTWGISDASGSVRARVPRDLWEIKHFDRNTALHNDSVFKVEFALDPQNNSTFSGSFTTATSNSPTLDVEIQNLTAGAIPIYIDVYAEQLNQSQLKKGQYRKIHLA